MRNSVYNKKSRLGTPRTTSTKTLPTHNDKQHIWPLGQAVKTPPFHGGITGSNPVGVTITFSKRSFEKSKP